MLGGNDRDYYLHRAQVELQRGDSAVNKRVAASHYELALRYSMLTADRTAKKGHLTPGHDHRGSAT